MRNAALLFVIATALSQPAFATKVVDRLAQNSSGCEMKENLSVSVNFNMKADSLMEAKAKFDDRMKQVADYAAQQKIENLEVQSMNYNIYSDVNNSEKTYQINGNVQYQMKSSDMAFKFAEFLEKQKMNVNINSNSYRQGNCN